MLKAVGEKLLTPPLIKAVLEEFQLPELKSEAKIFQTTHRAKLDADSFSTLPETPVKERKKVGYEIQAEHDKKVADDKKTAEEEQNEHDDKAADEKQTEHDKTNADDKQVADQEQTVHDAKVADETHTEHDKKTTVDQEATDWPSWAQKLVDQIERIDKQLGEPETDEGQGRCHD